MFFGEDIMKNKQVKRYFPCPVTIAQIDLCTFFLSLAFIAISISTEISDNQIPLVIGICLLVASAFFLVLSFCKWNAFVYIDDEKLVQKRFGKTKTLYYEKLTDVKIRKIPDSVWPHIVTVWQEKEKICFEITS